MSAFQIALDREPNLDGAVKVEDRRSNERTKVWKPVKIRLPQARETEEFGTLVDLSRDGLYFTTAGADYQVGMKVQLTLPKTGAECTCEIARIEILPQGRVGIGARILAW